ncbi:MAG: serine acetyltransferase, partial [Lachnospiraceae bacterium]|nr:serine acetyltransferase [Lachnospiraceae bacterium]
EVSRTIESYRICKVFFSKIPDIRDYIEDDLLAIYNGDPAAKCLDEIILAYPGLMAITTNRLAHELYLLEVPLLPRLMTEYAHSRTGIDIHPGATIGRHFFIDHGTGIVIGETSVIGNNVKIYQGVTIGALSVNGGHLLSNEKRHPTINDNVTIYAGASILGGDTIIGENSVIGANAFITSSVPAGSKISIVNHNP